MNHITKDSGDAAAVACTLGSAELGTQLERWRALYGDAGRGRIVADDGLSVRFRRDPVVEDQLRALAAVEIECCTWATWTVEVEDDELILSIRSSGNGIAVIHGWFLDEEPVLPRSGC
jgi:hypothetical protein